MQSLKPLNYQETYEDLLPKGAFRISPSMISKFLSDKALWYQTQVLGNNPFKGNTSTILGTCIHRIAERYTKLKEVSHQELREYIDSFDDPEIDKDFIKEQLFPMGQALINYLRLNGMPQKSEEAVALQLSPEVYVAGTCDALEGDTLIDYKTTSSLSVSQTIPDYYKLQLLTYAYIYTKLGRPISRIRIVWVTHNQTGRISDKTGKPLKDYPTQVVPVTQLISDSDLEYIHNLLHLIKDCYETSKSNPHLTYMLFSDYSLKPNLL